MTKVHIRNIHPYFRFTYYNGDRDRDLSTASAPARTRTRAMRGAALVAGGWSWCAGSQGV